MLLCRINWGCFICPPPPPLKLLKLSLVLCCYAVGPEVMLNQWSPGRLMWLRWCFLHPWKTVSNQDNSVVLAIMQFCINQAGAFNPPPPLKIMQLRWRCWWQSCSLFSGDSQSLAWLVIPSDAPQQLVASIPVQYHRSNIEKPDVYVMLPPTSWGPAGQHICLLLPLFLHVYLPKSKNHNDDISWFTRSAQKLQYSKVFCTLPVCPLGILQKMVRFRT